MVIPFEDLLGILLGFGRHNSQMYQNREKLDRLKGKPPFDLNKIKDIYKIKLVGFPHEDQDDGPLLNFINLPYFVEDEDHPESIQIRQKYIDTQKKLCKIFSQGHFLKIALEALGGKETEFE